MLKSFLLLLLAALPSSAVTISIQSTEAFIHIGGSTTASFSLNASSPEYSSSLDPNSLGLYRFLWTNSTGTELTNLRVTLFIDPDIDRDDNTFFNEYGDLVLASLPVGAPAGAILWTDWEVDEPEYTFGNIYSHAIAGTLDNSTGVPASAPDDVSHAFSFVIPTLQIGQSVQVIGTISQTDMAGLAHVDPDSVTSLYFNAYAVVDPLPINEVPEPASILTLAAGLAFILYRR